MSVRSERLNGSTYAIHSAYLRESILRMDQEFFGSRPAFFDSIKMVKGRHLPALQSGDPLLESIRVGHSSASPAASNIHIRRVHTAVAIHVTGPFAGADIEDFALSNRG